MEVSNEDEIYRRVEVDSIEHKVLRVLNHRDASPWNTAIPNIGPGQSVKTFAIRCLLFGNPGSQFWTGIV